MGDVLERDSDNGPENNPTRSPPTGAADPNAPSGASTAAPYFEDRRLLQLIAFSSLQILKQNSCRGEKTRLEGSFSLRY